MKGRKKKGYVKIHVAVDTKTKEVISLEVTDERTHDSRKLKELIENGMMRKRIKKTIADSGYDTKENFEYLHKSGIEAGIRVRDGSREDCDGARGAVIRERLRGWKKWTEEVGYGMRWIAESFFSAFKRLYGEAVRSKKWERIVQEIRLKVHV